MSNPQADEQKLIDDPRLHTFRRQLKAALKAGGVFYADEIAANIEGLITVHIILLIEDGAKLAITQDKPEVQR